MLEDHADAPAQPHRTGGVEAGDVRAVDQHTAAAGLLQPVDGAQQARLAGPAAADDAEDAAGRDLGVDVLRGMDRAAPAR